MAIDLCDEIAVELDRGNGWEPLAPDSLLEVTIDRGADLVDASGFAIADASTVTVLTNDPDTDSQRNPANAPGAGVRVMATLEGLNAQAFRLDISRLDVDRLGFNDASDTNSALFVGKVKNVLTSYGRGGDSVTTITGADCVEELTNRQTYRLEEETFSQRVTALADEAGVPITVTGGDGATLAPKESFIDAWGLMAMAAASEAGFVHPTRANELAARTRGAFVTEPRLEFSDVHDETNPRHHCYNAINADNDTARIVNTVTIANIFGAGLDGEDITTELEPYTDPDSIAAYGASSLALTTNLTEESVGVNPDVDDLAAFVLERLAHPNPTVKGIEYEPENVAAVTIDVGEYVSVKLADVIDGFYMVARVSHVISGGDGWRTTLGLWATGSDKKWL